MLLGRRPALRRTRRGPSGSWRHALRLVLAPSQRGPARRPAPGAYAVGGVLGGEQPDRGEHVVGRRRRRRALGAAASRPRGRRRCCRRAPGRRRPAAVARSTPPEPTSRSTSRRSLPVRSTTRPSGLTTTRRGRRAAAARGRRRPGRSPRRRRASASVVGQRRPGRRVGARARLGEVVEARPRRRSRPADQRIPRSPSTVRVTGVGGHHLAGQPARAVLGVELDDGVHVGGRAADVDHHHVAGTGCSASSPRQQLDAGEHHVGGRAADHRGEVGAGAEVLAADHVREEHLADRGPGAVGASTPIRGTTLSASTCGDRRPQDLAPPRRWRRRCRPPRPGRSSRPRPAPRAAVEQHLGVAAVGAADQQHDVRELGASAARSSLAGQRRPRPPCRRCDSATRRPASAVTSSSLPTTAIRSPPPALEQASTSAPAARGRPARQRGQAGVVPVQDVGADRGRVRRRTRRSGRRPGRRARPW